MALYTDLSSVSGSVTTDASAINEAIKNILTTTRGSMPGKPTFGSDINKSLFSHMTHITESVIVSSVREALSIWETRITVDDVQVKAVPEFNKIVVSIYYSYRDRGLNIDEQVSVSLI